jgi:hypothetical protein
VIQRLPLIGGRLRPEHFDIRARRQRSGIGPGENDRPAGVSRLVLGDEIVREGKVGRRGPGHVDRSGERVRRQ